MVTRLSDDIGHHLYLQSPLTHLGGEWRATFITIVFRQIFTSKKQHPPRPSKE